jgi:hypothetical protein
MASAALPLFFPAVELDNGWYGDGGIRLSAPLARALRLGTQGILAISTLYSKSCHEADEPASEGYPPPAQILGQLMNAIFLDVMDEDALLHRSNAILARIQCALCHPTVDDSLAPGPSAAGRLGQPGPERWGRRGSGAQPPPSRRPAPAGTRRPYARCSGVGGPRSSTSSCSWTVRRSGPTARPCHPHPARVRAGRRQVIS